MDSLPCTSTPSEDISSATPLWDSKLTFTFLELFEAQAILYNTVLPEFKNRVAKEKAWQSISAELQLPVDHLKKKLHNLRTQLSQQLKLQKDSKTSGTSYDMLFQSKWPYFNALRFLTPFITPKSRFVHDSNQRKTPEEEDTPIQEPPAKKVKKGEAKKANLKALEEEVLAKAAKALEKEEDQWEVFGQYVASELRTLTSESVQKRTKREITRLLLAASEECDNLDVYEIIESVQ